MNGTTQRNEHKIQKAEIHHKHDTKVSEVFLIQAFDSWLLNLREETKRQVEMFQSLLFPLHMKREKQINISVQ